MEAYKILIQAKDNFSKQFSKATAGLKKIGGAAKSAAKVVGGLSLAVIAAATAFVAWVTITAITSLCRRCRRCVS